MRVSIKVSAAAGSVTGEYIIPSNPKCMLTMAHGAGAGMQHPFMVRLAEELAGLSIATLRFNFPFMENGKRRPDTPAVAHQTIEAAIRQAAKKAKGLPLFISGKSFGGRMSSQYLSEHPDAPVRGIIFYGFPLHPPGKPGIERAGHLKKVKYPMLFLSGTRDEFATMNLLEKVCKPLKNATLIRIEGANHGFKAGKADVIPKLAEFTQEWMEKIK